VTSLASDTLPGKSWVAPTIKALPKSGIRRFFDLVSEMKGVISLGVGEPDFVTPWHIRDAAIYSLEKGYTMYSSNYGLLELRQEVCLRVNEWYGVSYDPRTEALITVGVSEALDLAFRAILNPGDEVIIPQPCYVSYGPCTIMAGGVPVFVETGVEQNFMVQAEAIERVVSPRTKAILLSYPNNPTGGVLSREEMLKIARIAEDHDLLVISDEIYADLTYEGEHTCFASLPGMKDRTILLSGFSKAYAMTGWRVGYSLANPEITDAMMKIHQYIMLCAPMMSQKAALEALKNGGKEKDKMKKQYDMRRRLIVKGLNDLGLPCFEPRGAFYAFPDIRNTGLSSEEFAERLLREEKVAVVPGNAFGGSGEGFVRCSYASSVQNINEALVRIGRFVSGL
jgi:aminotransferase